MADAILRVLDGHSLMKFFRRVRILIGDRTSQKLIGRRERDSQWSGLRSWRRARTGVMDRLLFGIRRCAGGAGVQESDVRLLRKMD